MGSSGDIDFFFWPRKDIEKIECVLFSKWHDDPHGRYLPLEVGFGAGLSCNAILLFLVFFLLIFWSLSSFGDDIFPNPFIYTWFICNVIKWPGGCCFLQHQFLLESVEWQSRLQGLMVIDDFLPNSEQVLTNGNRDVFLFVSRHQTQVSNAFFRQIAGLSNEPMMLTSVCSLVIVRRSIFAPISSLEIRGCRGTWFHRS